MFPWNVSKSCNLSSYSSLCSGLQYCLDIYYTTRPVSLVVKVTTVSMGKWGMMPDCQAMGIKTGQFVSAR